MSEDFNVGDVVVCVDYPTGPFLMGWEPQIGVLYRVADTLLSFCGELLVNLQEDPTREPGSGFEAVAFKKLPRADEEFTRQMRACKPKRVLIPAGIEGRG